MPTTIRNTPQYFRELRKLARKYPSVIQEVDNLVGVLKNDERPGDLIPNIGYEVYKVRLANPSAQKGTGSDDIQGDVPRVLRGALFNHDKPDDCCRNHCYPWDYSVGFGFYIAKARM